MALYAVFEYWESHIGQLNRKREYLDFLGYCAKLLKNLLKKKDMKWTDSADRAMLLTWEAKQGRCIPVNAGI